MAVLKQLDVFSQETYNNFTQSFAFWMHGLQPTENVRNKLFGGDLVSLRSKKFKNQNMHTIKNMNSENYVAKS